MKIRSRKLIAITSAMLAAVAVPALAFALCISVGNGTLTINHRVGRLYGANFTARVQCTRHAPSYIFWGGGRMCTGNRFYGRRNDGKSFSCIVHSIRI